MLLMLSELLSWESKWVLLVWWKLLMNVMYCCGKFWANWTGFWLFNENCWWMLCITVDYIEANWTGFWLKCVYFFEWKFPQMCVVLVAWHCAQLMSMVYGPNEISISLKQRLAMRSWFQSSIGMRVRDLMFFFIF